MTYLAYRNLFQNKFRLAVSVVGVALSIMLIIFLNGFLRGIYVQVTAYLDHTPADWVVAQDGVSNLLGATSLLPIETEDLADGLPGIDSVTPIIAQYAILDIDDEKVVGYMVGFDPDLGGGPWAMAGGRTPEDDDEIVLDQVMAEDHGLVIGDTIEILDEDFTVVGISAETGSWMANFFFVTKEAAEDLLLAPDATSFLLITARDDSRDLAAIEQRLRRRLGDDVEVVTSEQVKQNDLDLLVEIFAVPLQVMVSIAFGVGTAILGMIIYTATVSRAREYGVLKAVGATNRQLYGLVIVQALFISVVGVGMGLGLARIAADQVMIAYPKFLIVLDPSDVLPIIGAGLGMGLLAAFLPARYLGQLDPAQIFRK
jgi:putative ABC transport system permease protein